jgi:hypothetical protein
MRAMEQLEISSEPDSTEHVLPLVDEAIVHLKPKEQRCIVARFFDDASFKQIADTERITEDAAQKRVTRALDKMRGFLTRRGLKISGAAAIPALLTQSTRAADATLIAGIMHSIGAAKTTSTSISLALATKAAALIQWKGRAVLVAKAACMVFLIATPPAIFILERKPPIATAASMPQPAPVIAALGSQWAGVVRNVAKLIFRPQPNSFEAIERFNADYAKVVAESDRIVTSLNTTLDPQNERVQVAQFITVEVRENLNLNARQQAFVFQYVAKALNAAPTLKDGLNDLYTNRATHAQALLPILSIHQRLNFIHTYRRDGLGLFAVCPTLATAR